MIIFSKSVCTILYVAAFTILAISANAQNEVAIGSATTKSNAILWLNGNGSQGLILPTVSNKTSVSNPDKGMIVYDNSDNKVWYRNDNVWVEVGGAAGGGDNATLNLLLQGNQLQLRDGTTVLNSVNIAAGTQANGSFLVFQGGSWQFGQLTDATGTGTAFQVTGLRGKSLATLPATSQALVYDPAANSGNGGWVFQSVTLPTLANGQILTGNGTTNSATTLAGDATLSGGTLTISNNAITTAKINANAVDATKLADNAVTSAKIADATITGADIANNSITANKLAPSAALNGQVLKWNGTNWVPADDDTGIADGPILSSGQILIGDGTTNSAAALTGDATISGGTITISNNAITTAKINANAVDATKLADNAVTTLKVADNAITSAKIADATITGADIANTTITGTNIAATTITADKLAQSTATPGQVLKWNGTNWVPQNDNTGAAAPTLSNGQILIGDGTTNSAAALTGDATISGGTITISNNAITTAKINANAVDATKLADNSVTTLKVADNAITTAKINAAAVDGTKIADNAVTSLKITDGSVTGADIASATIAGSNISANTITGTNVAATSITADKLAQSAATSGQVLKWNGTNWAPADDDAGVGATPTLANGQILIGNGTTNSAAALTGDATISGGTITISNNAITTAKINANAVDATKLADNAVTTLKVADNAITTAKINANAVDATKLADNAVTTLKVADNAITSAKIVDATITGADIANTTITGTNIAATTITADKLAQSTATPGQVLKWNGTNWVPQNDNTGAATPTLSNGQILTGDGTTNSATTLTGDATISGGTITISNNAITTAKINANAVDATKLADNSVTTLKVADNAITTAKINAAAVDGTKIADNAVTSLKITDGSVTGADIASATIAGSNISANTITGANVAATSITADKLAQSTATSGQVLKWNGTNWAPADDDAGVGATPTLANGQILIGNGTTNSAAALTGDATISGGTITISNNAITTAKINANAVDATKLADNAVTTLKVADNAITSAKILDATVTGADIANTTITGTNIASTTITADKLAQSTATPGQVLKWNGTNWVPQNDNTGAAAPTLSNGQILIGDGTTNSAAALTGDATISGGTITISNNAITTAKINANAVDATKLADNAVTTLKVADNAITTAKINAAAVDGTKIADNAVTSLKITDGSVTGADIASATIAGSNISANTITGANVAATSITADKLAQSTATSGQVLKWNGTNWAPADDDAGVGATPTLANGQILIGDGTTNSAAALTGDATISGGTITISNNAITTAKINANAVDATKLADNAVTTLKVADNAITSAKILDATVTGADIANTTITGTNIAATTITADKLAQSTATPGQVLKWNGTNWVPQNDNTGAAAPTLSNGQILIGDGTTNSASSLTGDATLSGGTITIANNAITSTKIADGTIAAVDLAAGSVSGGTGGVITDASITNADIAAAAAIAGTKITPAFGAQNITTTGTLSAGATTVSGLTIGTSLWPANAAGALTNNGTGTLTWAPSFTNPMTTAGDIIYGGVGGTATRLATGTGFLRGGATPSYSAVNLASGDVGGVLPVANGGTGLSAFGGGLLYASSPTTIGDISNGTSGQMLLMTGTSPSWQSMSGDATINGTGLITIANNAITDVKVATGISGSKIIPNFGIQNIITSGTLSAGATTVSGLTIGTSAWPANASGVLTNNGTGTLTWAAAASGWNVTGNAGTNPATNFIGTTDAQPLRFATGVGGVERMRVSETGNVGIGTATPSSTIHVASIGNRVNTIDGSNTIGTWSEIRNTSAGGQIFGMVSTGTANIEGAGKLLFTKNNLLGSNAGTIMAFDWATANVGIGTTAPAAKVDIVGNIKITDGTQAAGRVLTSDANGLSSWTNPSALGWGLNGNAGTTFATNFIGTTDNIGLAFRTNNLRRMYITNTGQTVIDINSTNPIASPVGNAILDIVPSGTGIGNIVLRGSFANPNDPVDIEFRNWGGGTTLGAIAMSSTGQDMLFNVAGTTRMTLENAGNINFNNSNTIEFGGIPIIRNGSGTSNIFIGGNNANPNTANNGTFLGVAAGRDNSSGADNTFIGRNAGLENSTGTLNVYVGSNAGAALGSNGSGNTFVGYLTGATNLTGVRNTLIGREANVGSSALQNATAIGNQALVNQNNSIVLGSINGVNGATSNTSVGIGTTTPTRNLEVSSSTDSRIRVTTSTASSQAGLEMIDGTSSWRLTTNALTGGVRLDESTDSFGANSNVRYYFGTSAFEPGASGTQSLGSTIYRWSTVFATNGTINTSDKRLKKEQKPLNYGLNEILKLEPVTFKWINPYTDTRTHIGLMAQDVLRIIPEAVIVGEDEQKTLGLSYSDLVPVLIKSIQELDEKIEALKEENQKLKSENGSLESKVTSFEAQQQAIQKDVDELKRILGMKASKD
jgi:hypothetical protein